jgi:SAM-dependent methyltransferase
MFEMSDIPPLDAAGAYDPTFIERFQTRPRIRWIKDRFTDLASTFNTDPLEAPELDTRTQEEKDAEFEERFLRSRAERELQIIRLLTISPDDLIDPDEYAESRKIAPNWTVVEIGPGDNPGGINREFTGTSSYIGIENFSYGEYSDTTEEVFEELRRERAGENIFLMSDRAFGRQLWEPSEDNLRYDLPDGVANEVYISQVYDKTTHPTCQHNHDEQVMTNEVARLLAPDGFVVILDYDRNVQSIMEMLAKAGLKLRFASRETCFDIETLDSDVSNSVTHNNMVRELGSNVGRLLLIASK